MDPLQEIKTIERLLNLSWGVIHHKVDLINHLTNLVVVTVMKIKDSTNPTIKIRGQINKILHMNPQGKVLIWRGDKLVIIGKMKDLEVGKIKNCSLIATRGKVEEDSKLMITMKAHLDKDQLKWHIHLLKEDHHNHPKNITPVLNKEMAVSASTNKQQCKQAQTQFQTM